jgi:gas vesicle protein
MSDSIKLTKVEVLNISTILSNMKGNYVNKLKYAVKRNKDLIGKEADKIRKDSEPKNVKFNEYEDKRMAKIGECAARDESGRPVQETSNTVKIKEEKLEEFRAFIATLNEEYKEVLEERKKEIEDFQKSLEDEVEVEVYKISNDLIPEDLSQEQYEILFPLIND